MHLRFKLVALWWEDRKPHVDVQYREASTLTYTFVLHYVQTCVLGLDLATRLRNSFPSFSKACHVRWPGRLSPTAASFISSFQLKSIMFFLFRFSFGAQILSRVGLLQMLFPSMASPERWAEVACVREVTPRAAMGSVGCSELLSSRQMFDRRRPLVAPSDARSLGSLALIEIQSEYSEKRFRCRKCGGENAHFFSTNRLLGALYFLIRGKNKST